eukprot:TRINITY_DN2380_c0_g1_i1.p3 TRINITY_DN2380_c0_g1~~TRINITY_DN2380_c0_g1_i1.p3  ORF type:complete len:60 (-),score=14.53 TRINITY_DN2380_c0_g1_i1:5-184(-)
MQKEVVGDCSCFQVTNGDRCETRGASSVTRQARHPIPGPALGRTPRQLSPTRAPPCTLR